MADQQTFTITADDGTEDELDVPAGLLETIIRGERTAAAALGDIAMLAMTQHAHRTVHHSHGDVDDEFLELESEVMDLFEERFGATFGEVTGHAH